MNLIQQAEQLKFLPDARIQQLAQDSGPIPGYLVLAEMQRRKSMRAAYAASGPQNPMDRMTVSEEMRMSSPPMAERTTGMQPGQAPGRFAGGGLMRFEEGGWIDDPPALLAPTVRPSLPQVTNTYAGLQALVPRTTAGQIRAQFDEFAKPSPLAGMAEVLQKKEDMYRSRRTKLGDILMSLGLGMAASRRPDLGGAIAEGGIQALHGWQSERERNQALADRAAAERMAVLRAQQASDDVATREMGELFRAAAAGDNTAIAAITAAQRQAAGQAFDAQQDQAKLDAQWNELQAKIKADDERERWKQSEEKKRHDADRKTREDIAKWNNQSQENRQKVRSANKAGGKSVGTLDEKIRDKYLAITDKMAALPEMMAIPLADREKAISFAAMLRLRETYSQEALNRALNASVDADGPPAKKTSESKGVWDAIKEFVTPSKTERKPLPVVPSGAVPQGAKRITAPGVAPTKAAMTPPFVPGERAPVFGGVSVLARGLGLPTEPFPNQ